MEEDIMIIKELLQGAKDNGMYDNNKYFYSIENLIKGYRNLEIRTSELNGLADIVIRDYIPKSKVKEKIKELKAYIEQNGDYIVFGNTARIKVLQELLGDEE